MRYVKITSRCKEFDDYISENTHLLSSEWESLPTKPIHVKTALHNRLLKNQQGLCIYCQRKLKAKKALSDLSTEEIRELKKEIRKSMIEHIRPRTKDPGFTYVFCNLSVACNKEYDKTEYCEDVKHDKYDEELFLNPLENSNIEQYFGYDTDGTIFPKNNDEKAKYMISVVLGLNNDVLKSMREYSFLDYSQQIIDGEITEAELLDEYQEQLPEFYSMLKYLL